MIQGSLGDFRQSVLELLPCSFVANRLQGARGRLGPKNPLDGSGLKGLITDGVLKGAVNILTLVMLFHPQNGSSLKPTVSRMPFREPLEKGLCHLSQFQKGLPNWLQTIANLFGLEVIRVFYPFAKAGRVSLVTGKELNLGAVDQDLLLRGTGKLLVKDFLYSQKLQGLQMLPDFCQDLLRHDCYPLRRVHCIDPGVAG